MVKLGSIRISGHPTWQVVATMMLSDWYLGTRYWPTAGRPMFVTKGLGPIQFKRMLRYEETRQFPPVKDAA